MTTPTKFLLAAPLVLAASMTAGCDSDDPTSQTDYRAIAHVDLAAARAAPWVKRALGTDKLDLDGDLGACADILDVAQTVTLGVKDDDFEVYLTGRLDAAAANNCADHLDKLAKKSGKGHASGDPEGVMLDADLFAVFRGTAPSRARFETLLAADPSPSASKSMWVVAAPTAKITDTPVASVQLWAATAKGLDAHMDLRLKDETTATDFYGKAMAGLAAIQLSGDLGELAKGLKLTKSGDTVRGDVHIAAKKLTALIDKGKASAKARIDGHPGKDHGDHGLTISIGSEK